MARKSRKYKNVAQEGALAPLYKVGIYCRLSVGNHENMDDNSLGNQKKICMAYLEKQSDMEYCQTYTDNGKTGTNFERPGFQSMLNDIQKGMINCILVKDLSRFGRNFIETSMYLDLRFPEWDVRLVAVNNEFDTLYARSEEGGYDISIPFYNIMSDFYARDISQKITAVLHAKMKNGTFIPSSIPFGYLNDREHNTYLIDPVGAEVVRYIYQRRAEGASRAQIAKELNEKQCPTPVIRKRQLGIGVGSAQSKGIWSQKSVGQILRNQAYTGTRCHLQCDSKTKRLTPERMITIPNAHKAIVAPEIYEAAMKVEQKRRIHAIELKTAIHVPNYKISIQEQIFCGLCKQKMYVDKSGNYQVFRCSTERKNKMLNRQLRCLPVSISSRQVTVILTQVLSQQIGAVLEVEQILADVNSEVKASGQYKHLMKKKQSLSVRLNGTKRYLKELPYDLVEGRVTQEEYPFLKAKYQKKLEMLEEEQREFEVAFADCTRILTRAQTMVDAFHRFQDTNAVDEEILTTLVKKITVYPEHRVEITLTYQDIYAELANLMKEGE
jgi:DNA invertase Pin-like site-specific DNA recombinase